MKQARLGITMSPVSHIRSLDACSFSSLLGEQCLGEEKPLEIQLLRHPEKQRYKLLYEMESSYNKLPRHEGELAMEMPTGRDCLI